MNQFTEETLTHCRTLEERRELLQLLKDKGYQIPSVVLKDIDFLEDFVSYPLVLVEFIDGVASINLRGEGVTVTRDRCKKLPYDEFVSILMSSKYYIKPHNFIH